MREIKFRYYDNVFQSGMHSMGEFEENFIIAALNKKDTPYSFMQYTGLKDKNRKDIYEGDIVQDSWHNVKGEVIYSWTGFGLYHSGGHFIQFEQPSYLEVIGNIYENKELLND